MASRSQPDFRCASKAGNVGMKSSKSRAREDRVVSEMLARIHGVHIMLRPTAIILSNRQIRRIYALDDWASVRRYLTRHAGFV